jgi:hypothetical protein
LPLRGTFAVVVIAFIVEIGVGPLL